MASAALAERFDAGRAVGRAAAILRDNAGLFAALAVSLELVPGVIVQLAAPGAMGANASSRAGLARFGFGYFGFAGLVGLLITCVAIGAMLHVATTGDGPRSSFMSALQTGLRRALPLLGLFIVLYVGIVFGTVLLIVPGVILGVMWSVSAAVLVAEGSGVFASLGRSRMLTKGSRWTVLAMLVALLILYMLLFGVAALVSGGIDPLTLAANVNGFGIFGIAYRIASAAMSVVTTAVVAAIYLELRDSRDGGTSEGLAALFD